MNIFRAPEQVVLAVRNFQLYFTAASGGFILLALLAEASSAANSISTGIFHVLNGSLPAFLGEYLLVFMEFGSFWAISLVVVLALLLRRWLLAGGLVVAQLLSYFIANTTKTLVTFERPYFVLPDANIRTDINLDLIQGELQRSGFPSGHTAAAAVLAVMLWPYVTTPVRRLLLVLLATVLVGRVYSGVHFPLDVLGGMALGLTVGLLVRQVSAWLVSRSNPASSRPAVVSKTEQ